MVVGLLLLSFTSEAETFESPFFVGADVLRRLATGGALGGVSATVAFFLPRGILV